MADYETTEEGGFMDRIKESPRTVSALIIILIVAAAIYAFSGEDNQASDQTEEAVMVTEETTEKVAQDEEGVEDENEEVLSETETTTLEEKANTRDSGMKEASDPEAEKPVAEPRRTDSGFVEVAEAGNGVTHLARKASARWLSENQAGYAVSDEHRIFIEDYIQNKLGSQSLEVGEEVEVSFDLIREAVAAAGELSEGELNNLSQYTGVLQ